MQASIQNFVKENRQEMFSTLRELCEIPAPSHFEHERAEYCKKWLENLGAKGVYIDEALNVIFPLHCENSDEITVFAAHTDTVFPDRTPMPYLDDGEKIHAPGASDDTASVVVLLEMAKFFIQNKLVPEKGILFVCNSCEEGLGNLKGTRHLFSAYQNRIKQFISFDSSLSVVNDRCVGSHRYEVTVQTEGGHSYGAFGKENAIAVASRIVSELYALKVPEKEGVRTTYNVGTFSGGTSVNTIAQQATFLCEYRSDDVDCLAYMQKQFQDIFNKERGEKVCVNITMVGERPCASIDTEKIEALKQLAVPEIESVIGKKVSFSSSSTDCNIPLSLGVPAICVGTNTHGGVHTREEWVNKESIPTGLEVAIRLGLKLTGV